MSGRSIKGGHLALKDKTRVLDGYPKVNYSEESLEMETKK